MDERYDGGFLTTDGPLMTCNQGVSTAPLNMEFGYGHALGGKTDAPGLFKTVESTGYQSEKITPGYSMRVELSDPHYPAILAKFRHILSVLKKTYETMPKSEKVLDLMVEFYERDSSKDHEIRSLMMNAKDMSVRKKKDFITLKTQYENWDSLVPEYEKRLKDYNAQKKKCKEQEIIIWTEERKAHVGEKTTQTSGDASDVTAKEARAKIEKTKTELKKLKADLAVKFNALEEIKKSVESGIRIYQKIVEDLWKSSHIRHKIIQQHVANLGERRAEIDRFVARKKEELATKKKELEKWEKDKSNSQRNTMGFITGRRKIAQEKIDMLANQIDEKKQEVNEAESMQAELIRNNRKAPDELKIEKDLLDLLRAELANRRAEEERDRFEGGGDCEGGNEGNSPYVVDMSGASVIGGSFTSSFILRHTIHGVAFGFFIIVVIVCLCLFIWVYYTKCLPKKAKCIIWGIAGVAGAISTYGALTYGELYLKPSPEEYKKSYEGELYSEAKKLGV